MRATWLSISCAMAAVAAAASSCTSASLASCWQGNRLRMALSRMRETPAVGRGAHSEQMVSQVCKSFCHGITAFFACTSSSLQGIVSIGIRGPYREKAWRVCRQYACREGNGCLCCEPCCAKPPSSGRRTRARKVLQGGCASVKETGLLGLAGRSNNSNAKV
jgi:hypothetical protein